MRRGIIAAVVLLLACPASAAAMQDYLAECETAFCGGVSEDGSRAVFPFAEELTRGAERAQVYERFAGETRALVPYPSDPPDPTYAALLGLSADARHVFVWTNLALVASDKDGNTQDIYDISGGDASLLSTGPLDDQSSFDSGPGAPFFMYYSGASANGKHVFMNAMSRVVPEDTDACPDVYERFNGETRLVSTGPTATPSYPPPLCDFASYEGLSADGSHVFFSTYDHLVPEDDDGGRDVYQRVGETVTVLTTYPASNEGCVDGPQFSDASADGRTVLFATEMPISPADDDSTYDVYKREPDGSFTLVSRGTDGGVHGCQPHPGDGAVALSADGRTAIFETFVPLSPADRDSSPDLYSTGESGEMSLLTTGPTDASLDERVQVGPAWPADVSDDARSVAFESRQALVAADEDDAADVYLRTGGHTELVSVGPTGGNGSFRAELLGISGDGETIAFATKERLTDLDTDRRMDFYLRRAGQLSRPGSASSSKRRRRTVLVSAESVAPRMRVTRRGRLLGSRRAAVRIACPKAEKSGPCRGTLRLRRPGGRAIGRARFRVAAGRGRWVGVRLRRSLPASRRASAVVRLRGGDRLGNRALVVRRVVLAPR